MALELWLELDRRSGISLRRQLEEALREAIRSGRLRAGTLLPPSRVLAADLGVSRRLVIEAYSQLIAEAYLLARVGSGTRVAEIVSSPITHSRIPPKSAPSYDFRPGHSDLSLFPRRVWLHHSRRVLAALPDADLGYGYPTGFYPLQQALAAYLSRVRGVHARPEQVVIFNGSAQALSTLSRSFAELGHRQIGVEDPGAVASHKMLYRAGLTPFSIAVDSQGLLVDELRNSKARVVLCTPAHQFPSGVVLDPARRKQLLAWAHAVDGYILEDDYDAEFRYDRAPIGALAGLAPERVVYMGSLSKTLAAGLRLGWAVLPQRLFDLVVAIKADTDIACPVLTQATFASLLTAGDYDRQLRHARKRYRARRDALLSVLSAPASPFRTRGAAAGLHLIAELPREVNLTVLLERAAAKSVGLYPLDRYRSANAPNDPALVLGYGALSERKFKPGLRRLQMLLGA